MRAVTLFSDVLSSIALFDSDICPSHYIIIAATGFNPSLMGDIAYDVDGNDVDFAKAITCRGVKNAPKEILGLLGADLFYGTATATHAVDMFKFMRSTIRSRK